MLLVRTTLLPRSDARHACGVMVTGFRAKGWGSVMERAAVRMRRRVWVGEGIFAVFEVRIRVL